jgi:hypothetical protein
LKLEKLDAEEIWWDRVPCMGPKKKKKRIHLTWSDFWVMLEVAVLIENKSKRISLKIKSTFSVLYMELPLTTVS